MEKPLVSPFWVKNIKPLGLLSPSLPNGKENLESFNKSMTAVKDVAVKQAVDRKQAADKARDWYRELKKSSVDSILKANKEILENNPFKQLTFPPEFEQKEYFQYLIFNPMTGDINRVRSEVLRIINKAEINFLNTKPLLFTAVVLVGVGPADIGFIEGLAGFINMVTLFLGNAPNAQSALMGMMNNPGASGFAEAGADLLGGATKIQIDAIKKNANDTNTGLHAMLEPESFLGQFLKKSKSNKDQIVQDVKNIKQTSFFNLDAVPKDLKSLGKSAFTQSAKFSASEGKVTTSVKNPINRWIKIDKINEMLAAMSEQMESLDKLVGALGNVLSPVGAIIEAGFNILEGQTDLINSVGPKAVQAITDIANNMANLGDSVQLNAFVIPPNLVNKPQLEAIIQKYVTDTQGPDIKPNSPMYGAMVLCYTDVGLIAELAYKALSLMFGEPKKDGQ